MKGVWIILLIIIGFSLYAYVGLKEDTVQIGNISEDYIATTSINAAAASNSQESR
jgi:hypothetical protein